MRFYVSLILLAFVASFSARTAHAQVRGIGAGALVLDDNSGHTLIVETPVSGDPGFTSWASGGPLFLKLPLPPSSGVAAGFVATGPATSGPSQVLVWDPPTSGGGGGGTQGAWRPASFSSLGAISGTGTVGALAVWTGAGTVGSSTISVSGGVVTFGGYSAGVLHSSAAGVVTSSPVQLNTGDVSNTLPVGNGGTGAVTFTSGDLIVGNGTGALTSGPAWNGVTSTLAGNITGNAATATTATNATNATTATNVTGGAITNETIDATVTGNGSGLTGVNAASFTGTLSGDVTGTESATAIATTPPAGTHIVSAINSSPSTGTINATNGGTGNGTYAVGDILYASAATTLTRLPVGTTNQVLSVTGGIPAWTSNGATITQTTSTAAALSVNTNDFTVTSSSAYVRLQNISAGSLNVTGISSTGVTDGREITLVNITSNPIVCTNHDPGSASADQFDLPGGMPIILGLKGAATFIYDAAVSYWELLSTND
jgi:hypothetical protein